MEKRKLPAAERVKGMLGLAARAGRLTVGCDQTTEAVRAKEFGSRRGGNVCLVLLSEDAAPNTCKRVKNCCTYYETEFAVVPLLAEAMGHAVGKSGAVAVTALTDAHFASAVKAILESKGEAVKPREV